MCCRSCCYRHTQNITSTHKLHHHLLIQFSVELSALNQFLTVFRRQHHNTQVCWILQSLVNTVVDCTQQWTEHSSGLYTAVDCTQQWTEHSSEFYIAVNWTLDINYTLRKIQIFTVHFVNYSSIPTISTNGCSPLSFNSVPWIPTIYTRAAPVYCITILFATHTHSVYTGEAHQFLHTCNTSKHCSVNILIYIQQDATLNSLSRSCSTYFGWYLHPSSGAQTTI